MPRASDTPTIPKATSVWASIRRRKRGRGAGVIDFCSYMSPPNERFLPKISCHCLQGRERRQSRRLGAQDAWSQAAGDESLRECVTFLGVAKPAFRTNQQRQRGA